MDYMLNGYIANQLNHLPSFLQVKSIPQVGVRPVRQHKFVNNRMLKNENVAGVMDQV